MLVLTRKSREAVMIGGTGGFERVLKVTVLAIRGGKVQLGFEVDSDIPIHRLEVYERINAESQAGESMREPMHQELSVD